VISARLVLEEFGVSGWREDDCLSQVEDWLLWFDLIAVGVLRSCLRLALGCRICVASSCERMLQKFAAPAMLWEISAFISGLADVDLPR
jgi:hypothetical protein